MRRALVWLGAGVLALAVLIVATAPELVGADLAGVWGLLLVILLAGIPGVAVIAVAAVRRRDGTSHRRLAGTDGRQG